MLSCQIISINKDIAHKTLLSKALTNNYLHFYDGNGLVLSTRILFDLNNSQQIARGL